MDIGIDVEVPKETCDDRDCPFHGSLKVRGQIIKGKVVGTRMMSTALVERSYLRYLKKYERYEKRKSKYLAHNPTCLHVKVGDEVKLMECRPLSKTKSYVIIEKSRSLEREETTEKKKTRGKK